MGSRVSSPRRLSRSKGTTSRSSAKSCFALNATFAILALMWPDRPPEARGTAGRTLRLTTKAAPAKAKALFPNAITEDHVGETYFSCKGGTDWAGAVLDDVQVQPGPLDVLAAGGHFTILAHRKADLKRRTEAFANAATGQKRKPAKKKAAKKRGKKGAEKKAKQASTATFEEALVAILQRRLMDERGLSPTDLGSRVHVFDGSHLAAFLKHHRPSITSRFSLRLGIRRLEYPVTAGPVGTRHAETEVLP